MTTQKVDGPKSVSRCREILSQVIACLALDFLLVGLGMSISFVTMVLPEVLDAKEGVSITKKQASWFGSMAFLCQPLGSVVSGPLLDYFGRRKALFLVNIPHLVAWILMHFAWDVPSLFCANALLGIGTGIMEAPSITYVGEISDPSIRGMLSTMTNAFTSSGIFIAYLLGTVLPWRQAALVALVVPLTAMVLVLFVPETPIWLISKGRQKEALQSLCRLRGWAKPEHVKDEFDQLLKYNEMIQKCSVCIKTNQPESYPCKHITTGFFRAKLLKFKNTFLVKETLRPFTLVMCYFFFHTMSGLVPIRSNMVNICKALGMKYDPKAIVVFVGAISIVTNLVSAVSVKLIGKRKQVILALVATAFCGVGLSVYSAIKLPEGVFSYEQHTFPNQKEVLPVILLLLLVFFYNMGIPWVLLSELFPFRSRGVATSLAAAFTYLIFFLGSKTNYNLEATFQLTGTFAIYSCFGFIGAIYLYFFLPETEQKSLMDIEAYFKADKRIFADDFVINAFRKNRSINNEAEKPMLVTK